MWWLLVGIRYRGWWLFGARWWLFAGRRWLFGGRRWLFRGRWWRVGGLCIGGRFRGRRWRHLAVYWRWKRIIGRGLPTSPARLVFADMEPV